MNTTKKSINANLPRIDTLRRTYIPLGYIGTITHNQQTFKTAYVDVDVCTGLVTDISFYGVGDACPRYRAYEEEYCGVLTNGKTVKPICIANVIERWLGGTYYDGDGEYNPIETRAEAVNEIKYIIDEFFADKESR